MKYLVGAATAALMLVGASGAMAAANSSSDTANVSATIIQPITVQKTQDLAFGTIVKPSSASSTVTLTAAATPVRTVTGSDGIALASTTPTDGKFTVTGEGGQSFTLSIPASINMSGPSSSSITVTTSNDAGCTSACALSGSLGSPGTLSFNVGGSFTLPSTQTTGLYSGSVTATATYN